MDIKSRGEIIASADGLPLLQQLRELLSPSGGAASFAAGVLEQPVGNQVHDLLLACLVHDDDAMLLSVSAPVGSRAAVPARRSSNGLPFTEMEALTVLIRLLAVGTGDLTGDTVTPDPLDPHRVKELEGDASAHASTSSVARSLRSQALVLAVVNLIDRHNDAFERGQDTYLRLEALRALRLLLTPEGLLAVGGCHVQSAWWVEEELGYLRCGSTRRRLVEVLLYSLQTCGDVMGHKLKIATLGGLWSLVAASSYIRTRLHQASGEPLIAEVFRAQVRAPPPVVEAALVVQCGLLASIAAGGRTHERMLTQLGVDVEVLEMLRRYKNHRQVVCGGLVLLGVLANDESVHDRLLSSPELLSTIKAARDRWPQEAAETFGRVVHNICPLLRDIVAGKPLDTYLRLRKLRVKEGLPNDLGQQCDNIPQRRFSRQRRAASLRRSGGNMPRGLAIVA